MQPAHLLLPACLRTTALYCILGWDIEGGASKYSVWHGSWYGPSASCSQEAIHPCIHLLMMPWPSYVSIFSEAEYLLLFAITVAALRPGPQVLLLLLLGMPPSLPLMVTALTQAAC
jgi:hypothetical protein